MKKEKEKLQLVSFEQAELLIELGFDWECFNCYKKNTKKVYDTRIMINYKNAHYYENYICAPEVALALKWIREVKEKLFCVVMIIAGVFIGRYWASEVKNWEITKSSYDYETVESELLTELLNILKEK